MCIINRDKAHGFLKRLLVNEGVFRRSLRDQFKNECIVLMNLQATTANVIEKLSINTKITAEISSEHKVGTAAVRRHETSASENYVSLQRTCTNNYFLTLITD